MSSEPSPAPCPPPPPPPPAAPAVTTIPAAATTTTTPPQPPTVPNQGPPGAFLVELWTWDNRLFKAHWAYHVCSSHDPQVGVVIHATGDVLSGFNLECKRSHDLAQSSRTPRSTPLQWVDGKWFDEPAMLNHGEYTLDDQPVCPFETSAFKVPAPTKSLRDSTDPSMISKKVKQRDCQTWIVESARQLVLDGIFTPEVAEYLDAVQQ